MNEKKLNFKHRQEEELDTSQQQLKESGNLEFDSAEEMLRHDAENVQVPAGVANRLADSIRKEPPSSPWWKRIFR